MTKTTDTTMPALLWGDAGNDPIEDRLRQNIRATIEALLLARTSESFTAVTAGPNLPRTAV